MKINNITFENAGYGHVKVSSIVEGVPVSFTTDNTLMTDSASDEDDENYDVNMDRVREMLHEEYEYVTNY